MAEDPLEVALPFMAAILASCLAAACAEVPEHENCALDGCLSVATLTGRLQVPVRTGPLAVEWCRDDECIRDTLVSMNGGAPCTARSPDNPTGLTGVCLGGWLGDDDTDAGPVENTSIDASWKLEDRRTLPADGHRFHLRLLERDTGFVLLDVERTAHYEVTLHDDCNFCYGVSMTF